jgi:hypothetical protein
LPLEFGVAQALYTVKKCLELFRSELHGAR